MDSVGLSDLMLFNTRTLNLPLSDPFIAAYSPSPTDINCTLSSPTHPLPLQIRREVCRSCIVPVISHCQPWPFQLQKCGSGCK